MCESYNRQYGRDYRSVMPSNLYGPGDNYHSYNSHVIPGLIRRFHEAKIKKLILLLFGVQVNQNENFYLLKTWQLHVSLFTN